MESVQPFLDIYFGPLARPVLLFVFLAANALVGFAVPLPRRALPLFWRTVVAASQAVEKRLNRARRSVATRALRGFVFAFVLIGFSALLGKAVQGISAGWPYGWLAEFFLLSITISVSLPVRVVTATAKNLRDGHLAQAWKTLDVFAPWHGHGGGDAHAPARAAISFSAWALNRLLVGPAFWYLIFGSVGLCIYVAVASADRAMSYGDPQAEVFGKTAAMLDDIFNYAPARVSALLMVCGAAFVPQAKPIFAIKNSFSIEEKRTLNAGLCLAAMAGALGIAIADMPRSSKNQPKAVWIGSKNATAKARWEDVRIAGRIFMTSFLVLACMLCAMTWLIARFF